MGAPIIELAINATPEEFREAADKAAVYAVQLEVDAKRWRFLSEQLLAAAEGRT